MRAAERKSQQAGVTGVPAVMIGRCLITGAQPPHVYEQALREALSEAA